MKNGAPEWRISMPRSEIGRKSTVVLFLLFQTPMGVHPVPNHDRDREAPQTPHFS